MTAADRQAYLDAFSAAKKRVEREGREITHVAWRNGHLSFMATDRSEGGAALSFAEPDQGMLL